MSARASFSGVAPLKCGSPVSFFLLGTFLGMGRLFHTKVVGVTFRNRRGEGGKYRQDIIAQAVLNGGAFVEFEREYNNKYDKNAVAVLMDNRKIGYLNADLAIDVARFIKKGSDIILTDCEITGGTLDAPTYGVNLTFEIIDP